MTDKEAFELIGQRASELVAMPEIQAKMMDVARKQSIEAAETMVYMMAIGTLIGLQK